MEKFTKRFLKEVLQFTEEEQKLVMEVQRKFPELLLNDGECIDSARHLYLELGLNESNYSKWYKKNIINSEFFLEGKDWFKVTRTKDECSNNGHYAKDFKISLDFAKHLSMMQRTENSYKVRCYFILIEKAIRGKQEHLFVREPEKLNYKELCNCIEEYAKEYLPNADVEGLKKREANMLNECLLGMKALDIKIKLGYKDIETREHLEVKHNKALYELQLIDCGLINGGLDFKTRKEIIKNTCNKKFKDYYVK